MSDGKWTLLIHEIEGHGFSFEASDSKGKYLGTFERIEIYRHADWIEAHDENGEPPQYFPPTEVMEAGEERQSYRLGTANPG